MTTPAPPIRPAATLLLLRDTPSFQVLMVRRHHQIDFAGGALVFPGGKVEPHDSDGSTGGDGLDDDERAARVAAVREAFEESGVLLAEDETGATCRPGAVLEAVRAKVAAGEPLGGVLAAAGLSVRLDALTPFARWIAPAIAPKRYDTRFYLAEAPVDQVAACDGSETVDAEWIAPAEALRLGETGERTVIFPTRMNLRRLAESDSVAAALEAAGRRPMVTVEPQIERRGGESWLILPEAFGYGAVEEPFATAM